MMCCPVNLKSQSCLMPLNAKRSTLVVHGCQWSLSFILITLSRSSFPTLQHFHNLLQSKQVRLPMDNSTGVTCINHMGTSHPQSCNDITLVIWQRYAAYEVWLTAAHIPGKGNIAAEKESRKLNLDAEWKTDSSVLSKAFSQLDIKPTIDLFASRINKQLPRYISYRPDAEAYAVDAFSVSWKGFQFYAFPSFRLQPDPESATKDQNRSVFRSDSCTFLEDPSLVGHAAEDDHRRPCSPGRF